NIGVVTGYTGDSTLTEQGLKSELKRYKKGVDAVMDLKNSKLDAVVIDSPTAERFITQFGGLKGMKDTAVFGKEEYAIAVKKGNTELLEKVNTTIKRLKENGDIARFATEVDGRLGK
ncbi:MAG: transporter substrate-binding domain-containing protein, partial [Clostridia bacterium]